MDTLRDLIAAVECSWVKAGKPPKILLGCSGGADSAALLVILHELSLKKEGKIQLSVAHVDHGIRADSEDDAQFTEELCKKFSLPFKCVRLHLNGSSEAEARQERYRALFQTGLETNCSVIALAHHRQDQCETMLLHLMRGTGSGLAGMKEFSLFHYGKGDKQTEFGLWRPLLFAPPELLRRILRANNLSWREDSTNHSTAYLRNYLRLNVLPLIEKRVPRFQEHMLHTASILQEENDFFEKVCEEWISKNAKLAFPCPFLQADQLEKEHPALQKRILRAFLKKCGLEETLSYEETEALFRMKNGDKVNLPLNWRAERINDLLHPVSPFPWPFSLKPPETFSYEGKNGDGKIMQAVPEILWKKAVLRTRHPGDFIIPFGMQGKKSLQDYLVDRKIPSPFRDYLPLLCIGNEVIWVVGAGASEKVRSSPDEEKVFLKYTGNLPINFNNKNNAKGEKSRGK